MPSLGIVRADTNVESAPPIQVEHRIIAYEPDNPDKEPQGADLLDKGIELTIYRGGYDAGRMYLEVDDNGVPVELAERYFALVETVVREARAYLAVANVQA